MFGYRYGIGVGGVDNQDTPFRGRPNIDVVHAYAVTGDHFQAVGRRDYFPGKGRRPDDHAFDALNLPFYRFYRRVGRHFYLETVIKNLHAAFMNRLYD
ncbi:hypothetical protein MHLNE_05090 [Moorella humiferrea]